LVRSEEKTYDEALDIVHNHVTKAHSRPSRWI
jgi:hypothetical protein